MERGVLGLDGARYSFGFGSVWVRTLLVCCIYYLEAWAFEIGLGGQDEVMI